MRDFQKPGRSVAFGSSIMVAASHPQAALAAVEVLRGGGNAVDAAIAASAVVAVVEPTQTGIGGDCFVLLKKPGCAPVALNGSGAAPAAIDVGFFAERGITELDPGSAHAVTVPGAVGAWERLLEDHGTRPLGELLRPAIDAARDGYIVAERLGRDWALQVDMLKRHASTAAMLLPGGTAPRPGDRVKNPALASTLTQIAERGSSAFYSGPVAEDIVHTLHELDGVLSLEDLARYRPEYVTPISAAYRGYTLWECPPSGQGIVALTIASILQHFDLHAMDPFGADRAHLMAEATRLAYAERDLFLADPSFCPGLVDQLLEPSRIHRLAKRIDGSRRLDKIEPYPLPEHRDTIYVSVVDANGMAVSFINSIFDDFGSGVTTKKSGILLHNRGCGFSLLPGHVNAIAGNKRPMHTIIPALVTKDNQVFMSFGVTGGHFQAAGQIQVLSNIVDHGMSVQEAIDAPRFFARGDSFEVERGVSEPTRARLSELGHKVIQAANPIGTCQAILMNQATGVLHGGADARRDGIALGD